MTRGDRRLVLGLLTIGQVAVWSTIFLSVFLGPFAVEELTGSFALGGLPFAMYYLSNLLVIVPAGRLMDRLGRAPVLGIGHGVGAAGAACTAAGLFLRGTPGALLFLVGLFLLSAGSSVALLTRVAVTDLYPPEARGRGVSRILLTSLAGSAAGAAIFLALSLGGTPPVASGYLTMVPVFLVGLAAMLLLGRRGPPASARSGRSRLRTVFRRPGVPWTVASNAGAQAGMGGVMSVASAALAPLGGPVTVAVLLGHFSGMFLPSPAAGHVADRQSRSLAILLGGGVLAFGALLFVRTDLGWIAGAGLFLVGAGWCFTFIPGTAILADSTSFQERGTLFGGNDAIVSLVGGAVTILAGFAFATSGALGVGVLGAACGLLPLSAGVVLRRRALRPSRVGDLAPADGK